MAVINVTTQGDIKTLVIEHDDKKRTYLEPTVLSESEEGVWSVSAYDYSEEDSLIIEAADEHWTDEFITSQLGLMQSWCDEQNSN